MARVLIKPIEPLEMEFSDGTVKKALFNNEAFIFYTDEFGALDIEKLREMKDRPYDLIARFLYCGMKVYDRSITLDEAERIVVGGGEALGIEIVNLVTDNFMATADENAKKKVFDGSAEIHQDVNGIDNGFWEIVYFAYCIKLGRSEEEFFRNTTAKTIRILEINTNGIKKKPKVKYVNSMRDFLN